MTGGTCGAQCLSQGHDGATWKPGNAAGAGPGSTGVCLGSKKSPTANPAVPSLLYPTNGMISFFIFQPHGFPGFPA